MRYVEEFEEIGSRESEGQIDEAANAVRLMTIHQAKGLEFPVVIIPDLQRLSRVASDVPFPGSTSRSNAQGPGRSWKTGRGPNFQQIREKKRAAGAV